MTNEPISPIADAGKAKPKCIAKDGESVIVAMSFMDGRTVAVPRDTAGREAAYAAYVRSLNDGWRSSNTPSPDRDPTPLQAVGEGVADAGTTANPYQQYVDHIQNAWKNASNA
jgi:hypothetical protein